MSLRATMRELVYAILRHVPLVRIFILQQGNQCRVRPPYWFWQKVLGFNRQAYWPMHHSSRVTSWRKVIAGIETCPGYMPGCYIQGTNGIEIGDYTQIGPGVGLISSNHDLYENQRHAAPKRPIRIGAYGWIGMNAVILPGVRLGDFTIVAANSLVTRSFPKGYCVIGGNPATKLYSLDPAKCVRYRHRHEFNGYIPHARFARYCREHLATLEDV